MKEILDIVQAFDEAQKQSKQTVLATVVHVEGSSYRRPGARMLITEDGNFTGAISGGCLEGDALRKALLAIIQKKPKLVTYDTNDEDDAKLGLGLGCNGIIQVLIEPVDPNNQNNPVELLRSVISKRSQNVLVTLFSLDKKNDQYGTCLLIEENKNVIGEAPMLNEILINDAREVFSNKRSLFKNYNTETGNTTAFIEFLQPAISLIIIGAGNDAMPLVKMADVLGWETTVADGRGEFAKKERFIAACQVMVVKPENVLEEIKIDEQTAFVLMTHNYNYDLAMLRVLLQKKIPYIGSLGPRNKLDRMIKELQDEGIVINSEQLSCLYGPIGLDIGAETPEEIALSVLAEIKAVFSSRSGQPLRESSDTIHSRSYLKIQQAGVH